MSLLDTGNETVVVFPHQTVVDSDGNRIVKPSVTGVTLQARVQPGSSLELPTDGQQLSTIYTVITRDAPTASWSYCMWRGLKWDVVGEILRYNGSYITQHVTWVIKEQVGGSNG